MANRNAVTPQLSFAGRSAIVLLDAPERRNALGPADLRALAGILAEIDRSDADVALLRATGGTFCAGYDLNALRGELRSGSESAAGGAFAQVVDALENLRVPTICTLRGGAYGGGSDLALACDIRVGTRRAAVAVPAARFGLQFYHGGLRRYVERIGLDAAKRIFLLAETLDASELLRIGYLHAIVGDNDVDAYVDALAARAIANSASAVRGLKRSLNAIARGSVDASVIDDSFAESLRSPDTLERLSQS